MTWSLNEIETLSRKAARGAGLSWGLAEEAGKATRWLAAAGLPGPQVLAATPGRLNDFLAPPPGFSAPVRATHAKYVVLDEADRMLDMGFEPQIRKILKLCPSARQTLMFTATWPEAVKKIAAQFTNDPTHVRIGDGGTRLTANTSITQTVELLEEESKLDRAIEIGRAAGREGVGDHV